MADFLISYKSTSKNEGGYANDPKDRGGETWKGIARNFFPKWAGWNIIDYYKTFPDFKKRLAQDDGLELLVQKLYRVEFWDKIKGDEIKNQKIANSIYDSSVNLGVKAAIKLAQRSLGLTETGVMNMQTINKLNA